MTITFNTKEVASFLKRSKTIRQDNRLPSLSCILYKNGTLTKSNLDSFYRFELSNLQPGEVLLDERILSGFISDIGLSSESFTVEVKGSVVFLRWNNRNPSFQTLSVDQFPTFPERIKEFANPVPDAVWDAIHACKSLTAEDNSIYGGIAFVNVTPDAVYASDRAYAFAHKEKTEMEEALLHTSVISMLSGLTGVCHVQAGSYDFFQSGRHEYAFIRSEEKVISQTFETLLSRCTFDQGISLSRHEIISFCDFIVSVFPVGQNPHCLLNTKDKGPVVSILENEYGFAEERQVEKLSGDWSLPVIKFSPKSFSTFLQSLPGDTIRFSPYTNSHKLFTITTPDYPAFTGIMTGMEI